MKNKTIDGITIEHSSGNVFADLGLRDAKKLKVKSGLAIEIVKTIRRLELSQTAAGTRMGISQSKVSNLLRGDFTNLSESKLMECLNRLGCDIEIVIKPSTTQTGELKLAYTG
ncbi:helix-turn-helix domain-containing protein [Pantoea sp. FN060301]|uniref:helix-turn-helix domain-containing protein n=1 Tax=Pantoea sp. FN060301 TaxID=3420380 RepID=UPI003D1844C4